MSGYLYRVLIAVDQLFNSILGGWPDETLSARAWRCKDRNMKWKIARIVIDTIFFLILIIVKLLILQKDKGNTLHIHE